MHVVKKGNSRKTVERRWPQEEARGAQTSCVEAVANTFWVEMPCITIAGDTTRGFFDFAPKAGAPLRMTADAVNEDTV